MKNKISYSLSAITSLTLLFMGSLSANASSTEFTSSYTISDGSTETYEDIKTNSTISLEKSSTLNSDDIYFDFTNIDFTSETRALSASASTANVDSLYIDVANSTQTKALVGLKAYNASNVTVEDIQITVSGEDAQLSNSINAINASSTGTVVTANDITITIKDDASVYRTWGVGYIDNAATLNINSATVNVYDSDIEYKIICVGAAATVSVTKDISLNMENSSTSQIQGYHVWYDASDDAGSVSFTAQNLIMDIKNSTITGDIMTGYVHATVDMDTTTDTATSTINGNVTISLTDTTVTGNIYAAGYNTEKTSASIEGNITLNIDGGSYGGDIYLAQYSETIGSESVTSATVGGSATLNITGNTVFATNSTITGGTATEGTTLNFGTETAGYTGTFTGNIADFDAVNITSNSSLTWSNFNESSFDNSCLINNDGYLALVLDTSLTTSITLSIDTDTSNFNVFGGTYTYEDNSMTITLGKNTIIDYTTDSISLSDNSVAGSSITIQDETDSDILILSFSDTSTATVASAQDVTNTTTINDLTTLSAWAFDITLESGETVVLSYYVGTIDLNTISLYHIDDDGNYIDQTGNIVSYDDEFIVFEVDSFSTWAITTVPEPSTYAMIFGALALALAIYRRRK